MTVWAAEEHRIGQGPLLAQNLTIVTVTLDMHRAYLRQNRLLLDSLCEDRGWRWLVVDNSISEEVTARVDGSGPGVIEIAGVPKSEIEVPTGFGSYHHAAALNKALSKVSTRFLLVLDPDFFIVRPNWIQDVLSYMLEQDVGVLGVPWHPRWHNKWRYFPCVHCLFIDLAKVDPARLDFTPELLTGKPPLVERLRAALTSGPARAASPAEKVADTRAVASRLQEAAVPGQRGQESAAAKGAATWTLKTVKKLLLRALNRGNRGKRILRALSRLRNAAYNSRRTIKSLARPAVRAAHHLLLNRELIAHSKDTGYRLLVECSRTGKVKVETYQPVVYPAEHYSHPPYLRSRIGRLFERMIPDKWSYIPKKPGYISRRGFRDFGYMDLTKFEWEEFMWSGEPFGFHLRNTIQILRKKDRKLEDQEELLIRALGQFNPEHKESGPLAPTESPFRNVLNS